LFGHFPLIFKWKFCLCLAAGGSGWRLVETNLPRNIRLELVDAEESRERDGCPFPAFHFAIGR